MRLILILTLILTHRQVYAQQAKLPDTTGLKIFFAGHAPKVFPYKDSIRELVFTTSLDEVSIHSYEIVGMCRGCDYWGPEAVKGNHLHPLMQQNLFRWTAIYLEKVEFKYNNIIFKSGRRNEWVWYLK